MPGSAFLSLDATVFLAPARNGFGKGCLRLGDAMRLLATALKTGSQPPERTLVCADTTNGFPSQLAQGAAPGPASLSYVIEPYSAAGIYARK
jgi:hypothetical protein